MVCRAVGASTACVILYCRKTKEVAKQTLGGVPLGDGHLKQAHVGEKAVRVQLAQGGAVLFRLQQTTALQAAGDQLPVLMTVVGGVAFGSSHTIRTRTNARTHART